MRKRKIKITNLLSFPELESEGIRKRDLQLMQSDRKNAKLIKAKQK